jgi:hypothetical protein
MLSPKKSDLKNHLSTKHSTWAHKVVAKPTHDETFETELHKRPSPERDPPPKAERLEAARS